MSTGPLEVLQNRATSVIVQRIPAGAAEAFLKWQDGISNEAARFPGYQTTEIYPPLTGNDQWVALIHFDGEALLRAWLDSSKRAEWVAKLPGPSRGYRLKTLPTGFGAWLAGLAADDIPRWKRMGTVLCGLYPTVMGLTLLLWPYTVRLGTAADVLVGNACSVVFLEFVAMPAVTRLLGPWLRARGLRATFLGTALIATGVAILTFLFHLAA